MIISIFKDIQITQFTRKGVTWHTPLNDIVGLSLYLLGTFENKNIKKILKYIKKDTIVIDIGANVGAFTIGILKKYPQIDQVVCYEPEKSNYINLNKNITENNLDSKTQTFNKFIGDGDTSRITSNYPLIHKGAKVKNIYHGLQGDYENVQKSKLEEIVFEENKNYLIKIDVDGYEANVMSAINEKLKYQPIILIEINKVLMTQNEIHELIDTFERNKYKFLYFNKLVSPRIILKDPRKIGLDIIAIPSHKS